MHTQYNKYTSDDKNTHKTTTTIRTRQLQQYTQDNYNNTHKTTNNNTHKKTNNNTHKTTTTITYKTTTTIHTANQQQLHKRQFKTSNKTQEAN